MSAGLLLAPPERAIRTDAEFARSVDDLTRRGFLGGLAATGTATAIGGCGSGSRGDSVSPAVRTRTVSTIHGDVEVPVAPARVVTVSFVGTANLLDLGVTPVGGVTSGVEFLPRYKGELATMTLVANDSGEIALETVASCKPDLIVGSDWADPGKALLPYEKLSQIAPTALFAQAASVGNWPDQAHAYANAVNRLDKLTPLQAAYRAEQKRIRRTYADLLAEQRWVLVNASESGWYRYSAQASHCKVLAGAGVRFIRSAVDQKDAFEQLSFEQLGQLGGADVIGVGRAAGPTWAKALTGQPLFRNLPAVRAGHLYNLKWFFPSSYGTARALLDQVDPILGAWKAS